MRPSIALCLALLGACGAAQDDETRDLPEADELEDRNEALTPCASGSTCLRGSYAVRSARFVKTRSGSDVSGKKIVEYALVTITRTLIGTLRLSEKLCYSESVPLAGPTLYEWSKPAWLEALPVLTTSLSRNANGTYTRSTQVTAQGWSAARQPSSCTSASTPLSPWPAAWGASCRCNTPASSLPPFSLSSPYDCRAVDADLDGYPGWSSFASVTPPSAPASDPSGVGWARLLQASNEQTTWTITPSGDGRHEASIADASATSIIGCTGGGAASGCSFIRANALVASCPQRFNKALFVPVTSNTDTCAEIVAARNVLFSSANDGALPSDAACPPP